MFGERVQPTPTERVVEPNFYDWSIYIENEIEGKPLWPEIVETLDRNFGFDDELKRWTPVSVNSAGRPQVSAHPIRSDNVDMGYRTVPMVGMILLSARPTRLYCVIKNISVGYCYLTWKYPITPTWGYYLNTAEEVIIPYYTGQILAVGLAGPINVQWIEIWE